MNKAATLNEQQGVAMVEFAIVAPLLIILFLGITEFGHALYQHNTINKAVAVGARYLARTYEGLDVSCNPVAGVWATAKIEAENLVVFGNINGTGVSKVPGLTPGDVTIYPPASVGSGSVTGCVVTVVVNAAYDPIFSALFHGASSLLSLPGFRLYAASQERYIGE